MEVKNFKTGIVYSLTPSTDTTLTVQRSTPTTSNGIHIVTHPDEIAFVMTDELAEEGEKNEMVAFISIKEAENLITALKKLINN